MAAGPHANKQQCRDATGKHCSNTGQQWLTGKGRHGLSEASQARLPA